MQRFSGEFNCYCEYLEDKTYLDFVHIEKMFDSKNEMDDKCKEYTDFKFRIKFIKLMVTLFMSVSNAISK